MSVFEQDLQVDQGEDFSFTTIPWIEDGVPVDFTGATARMMVRRTVDSDEVLVSITTTPDTPGSIVLHGTAGTATINLSNVATTGLPYGASRQDLFIDFPSGKSRKLLTGRFLVGLSVTR